MPRRCVQTAAVVACCHDVTFHRITLDATTCSQITVQAAGIWMCPLCAECRQLLNYDVGASTKPSFAEV